MSEDSALAQEAGPEDVETPETEEAEGQTEEGQAAEADESDEAQEEGASEDEAEDRKKRESAKERREREKALKQRLRDEAKAAMQRADEAEKRAQRIIEAGNADQEPQESDFPDYAEYVAAKAVWRATAKGVERDAQLARNEADEARQEAKRKAEEDRRLAYEAFEAGKIEARSRYQNYDDVVGQPGLFPVGSHLPDLVLQSDLAPDLAYIIASDRTTHDRLLSMSPVEAAREIGRMEASLAAPRPRTQSAAPQPIAPVKAQTRAQPDPSKMSYAAYKAWREGRKA